jgi:hypothetical protein
MADFPEPRSERELWLTSGDNRGATFRAAWRKVQSARARARRNQRGRRPVPGITGVRVPPPPKER